MSDVISLPDVREELTLYAGPQSRNGAPTWVLLDPVRNRFFQLPWAAVEILARWHLKKPDTIAETVKTETTLSISADDVVDVGRFLYENQLLIAVAEADTERFASGLTASKSSWLKWLLHHYLFFRIPIVRPDAFLSATAGAVAWMFSTTFLWITILALGIGLFLTSRQWDTFLSTFVDLLSWHGFVWYLAAYAFVKVIHELGHGFTAKRFGCSIPTMGVAFLVLWPVLYTDTNDVWKLSDKRQRLAVAAAGVSAEFMVAAWATLVWSLLPDGPARMLAFLLATTTWISSIVINLSPFMRFDGYFLLMDWLEMPNLHSRSFALARWKLREFLFGLGEEPPEHFGKGRAAFLIIFAFATWAYRLLLFLGIAVLVYHFFIKAVGVFLFLVEMGWFVIRPIWAEMVEWGKRGKAIAASPRKYVLLLTIGAFAMLLAVPWHASVTGQGVLQTERYSILYAPGPGLVERLNVKEQQKVVKGQSLVRMKSPELNHKLQQIDTRINYLQSIVDTGDLASLQARQGNVLIEELRGAKAERNGLRETLARYEIFSPFQGVMVDLAPDLHSGQWVPEAEPLLAIRSEGQPRIEIYVDEDAVHRIKIGATGRFFPDDIGVRPIGVKVEGIDRTGLRVLNSPYVASVFGGQIPVRKTENALVPERAIYRLRLSITDNTQSPIIELRGTAHVDASPESLLSSLWRSVAVVFLRESGA